MPIPMETIICAIAENMDVKPELAERAVAEGFAEWVKVLTLTEKGDKVFTDKYLREVRMLPGAGGPRGD